MTQVNRPARGEVRDLIPRPPPGSFEKPVEDAPYVLEAPAGREAVVDVDPELVRHHVLGPAAPRHRRRENLVEREPVYDHLLCGAFAQLREELAGSGEGVLPQPVDEVPFDPHRQAARRLRYGVEVAGED